MSEQPILASAPGSLMLFGEHAVLRGMTALACAIEKRITVTVRPRQDRRIIIRSVLGTHESSIDTLRMEPPFAYVTCALLSAFPLPSGCELEISADFSHEVGLGSSAAVTVATVAALARWQGKPCLHEALCTQAVAAVRAVQGVASGTDVAASVYGGIVAYRMQPPHVRPIRPLFDLTVVYSGSKMPTPQVVQHVRERERLDPQRFQDLFSHIGAIAEEATGCIERQDWQAVGRLCNQQQELMEAIGVSNDRLRAIIQHLRRDPNILGAKISGSGLGDCAIGLGSVTTDDIPYPLIPVRMSEVGVL